MYKCELNRIPKTCKLCRFTGKEMCYECIHFIPKEDKNEYSSIYSRGIGRDRGTRTRIIREISGISL